MKLSYGGIHMENEKPRRSWGDTFGIIGLIFGIFALVVGVLALIPLLGLGFAVVTGVLAVIALACGIVGSIKAVGKGKCITAIVFGATMLVWAIVRYFWVFAAVASAAASTSAA